MKSLIVLLALVSLSQADQGLPLESISKNGNTKKFDLPLTDYHVENLTKQSLGGGTLVASALEAHLALAYQVEAEDQCEQRVTPLVGDVQWKMKQNEQMRQENESFGNLEIAFTKESIDSYVSQYVGPISKDCEARIGAVLRAFNKDSSLVPWFCHDLEVSRFSESALSRATNEIYNNSKNYYEYVSNNKNIFHITPQALEVMKLHNSNRSAYNDIARIVYNYDCNVYYLSQLNHANQAHQNYPYTESQILTGCYQNSQTQKDVYLSSTTLKYISSQIDVLLNQVANFNVELIKQEKKRDKYTQNAQTIAYNEQAILTKLQLTKLPTNGELIKILQEKLGACQFHSESVATGLLDKFAKYTTEDFMDVSETTKAADEIFVKTVRAYVGLDKKSREMYLSMSKYASEKRALKNLIHQCGMEYVVWMHNPTRSLQNGLCEGNPTRTSVETYDYSEVKWQDGSFRLIVKDSVTGIIYIDSFDKERKLISRTVFHQISLLSPMEVDPAVAEKTVWNKLSLESLKQSLPKGSFAEFDPNSAISRWMN